MQEFEFSGICTVWAWFGPLTKIDFNPQRIWSRTIIGWDMAILSFLADFEKKIWKIYFWDLDSIFWPRMTIFGYMMPKVIRIGIGFENLSFVKSKKIFSIWVLKPHMWLNLPQWSRINQKVTPFWKIQVQSNILGQFPECRFFAPIT